MQRPLPAQHTTFTRDRHPCARTRNPSNRAAAYLRLKTARPLGSASLKYRGCIVSVMSRNIRIANKISKHVHFSVAWNLAC
jgi:hypothetical protein